MELQEWEDLINSNKTRVLAVIRLVSNKNLQVYKEHVILYILFAFGEGVTNIYWLANMKLYVSNIEKPYKDTKINHLVNSGIAYLLHIL